MGLAEKNPLSGMFICIFLSTTFFGGSFLYDVYKWHFSYQRLPFYLYAFIGFLFLYCYTNNIKFAWHVAFFWLFAVCFGLAIKTMICGVDPSRPHGKPWIQTKEDVVLLSLFVWVILANSMRLRYGLYMNFVKNKHYLYDD
jgi:hypothetical protein